MKLRPEGHGRRTGRRESCAPGSGTCGYKVEEDALLFALSHIPPGKGGRNGIKSIMIYFYGLFLACGFSCFLYQEP